MSLINDALKRAKQAHTENPTPTPNLPFRAAEPSQNRNSGFPLLPAAGLVLALVLGGGLILLALQKRDAQVVHATQPDVPVPSNVSPAAITPPTASPTATPVAQSTPATTVVSPAQAGSTPVPDSPSGSTPDTSVATPNPESPKPAPPKLQGIFYNPSRPSAVVSGKTVYVGSRAGEARDFLVLEISRQSVTVANGSQTNVLVLEE